MLVEEYLVAVVSLPAGVFNPYSGVKTSILLLDKSLARQSDSIGFFKIENDGFGLGAQRREIARNDLPQARAEIAEYLRRLRARDSAAEFEPTLGLIVSRPMNKGEVVITVSGNPGLPTILAIDACIHDGFVGLRELSKDVVPAYLYFALLALHARHGSQSVGAVFKNLTSDQIREFKIALPRIATQQSVVAEIEAEQALVAGNRELITRFEKKIQATLARVWGENEPPPANDSASIRSEPSAQDSSPPAVAELLPH
jgi:hypothetical protein